MGLVRRVGQVLMLNEFSYIAYRTVFPLSVEHCVLDRYMSIFCGFPLSFNQYHHILFLTRPLYYPNGAGLQLGNFSSTRQSRC